MPRVCRVQFDPVPGNPAALIVPVPAPVRTSAIERVHARHPIYAGVPFSYYSEITLVPGREHDDLYAACTPKVSETQISRLNGSQYIEFAHHTGLCHNFDAPGRLQGFNRAIARQILGLSRREALPFDHRPPYEPYGPWEFIPPEDGYDWRVRAHRTIPKASISPIDLVPRLVVDDSIVHAPLVVTVTYSAKENTP